MLLEMIEPKLREINEKFTSGKSLTQDDINTLLLKSQYNHINHLDDKLNETVESVKNLEHKFEKLEQKYENDFKSLEERYESNFKSLEERYENNFKSLEEKYKSDFKSLEQKYESDFKELKNDFKKLEQKYESDFDNLKKEIEATIQKSLNKNMMMLIAIIGTFLTIYKIIDKF
jgi:DNA repair ATPase RecN